LPSQSNLLKPSSTTSKKDLDNEELKKLGILNLSTHFKIKSHHANLLQKGLSFVPVQKNTPTEQFSSGIDKFVRNLKIKFTNFNFNQQQVSKFKIPSNYIPYPGSYPPDIDQLSILLKQELRKIPEKVNIKENLTKEDRNAIKELKDKSDIVIKSADKGSAIVIMDRKDYVFEAERQLKINRHYREIDEPQFPRNCEIFNRILNEMKLKGLISSKEINFLRTTQDARERIFYLLPKIHKETNKWTVPDKIPPGRPIVSDVNSESYAISKFIDYHLAPYATSHPAYVKNTYDFLDKIQTIKTHPNALLISLDVDSLYTNIDNEMGIRAVTEKFATDPKPIHKYIIKLLRLSLEGNDFIFDGKHYLQVSGTAMGKKFAPHYADITMAYWEANNLTRCENQPRIYLRYLDDIFMIWEHPRETFDDFFNVLNTAHPNIKLKSNIQETELEFLDVLIYKGDIFNQSGTFDTKVYFKPTDSHALLHKQSFHPNHTFAGIIKSQLVRFGRICQLEKDFDEATSILFRALYPRGYSKRFLRDIKSKTKVQFFPPDHLTGMKPCKRPRCSICKYVNTDKTVNTSSKEVKLFANGNCDTQVAIYLISCKQCPQTHYVGQTINLRGRILSHLSSIRKNSDKKVHQHFKSPNHSLADISITILEIPKSNKQQLLDRVEKQWIRKIDSFHQGLNSDLGNTQGDVCTLISQHHPTSQRLVKIARDWLDDFKSNSSRFKKHPVTIIKANARNKNLSQHLVRAMLKDPNPEDPDLPST
jgi:hypothetical protein